MQGRYTYSRWTGIWSILTGCAALGCGAIQPQAAHAQDMAFWDGKSFSYEIYNVPDLDQRRGAYSDGTVAGTVQGLPNNGAMYCVPTAALNWVGYIASHGYPLFAPGATDWQQGPPYHTEIYNLITGDDYFMGELMGTDPVKGTTDGWAGLQQYLDDTYPGVFVVTEDFAHDSHCPTYKDMALQGIWGGLVDAGIGFYDLSYPHQVIRAGGHHVSLVGSHSPLIYPGDIWFNDPADDTNLYSQSLFPRLRTM